MQRRLAQKYRIVTGVACVVIVGGDGVEISRPSRDALVDELDAFPWRPRRVADVLADVPLDACPKWPPPAPTAHTYAQLQPIIAFYFAAHWCPPCRAFTPLLVHAYEAVRRRGHGFQVVFVSSDRSQDSYDRITADMPWLTVPWSHAAARKELASALNVHGIPALRIVSASGSALPAEARHHVVGDPDGLNFPWKPAPVNILTERYLAKLQEHPALVLFIDGDESEMQFAKSVLHPTAESYYEEYRILHPAFDPYQYTPDVESIDFEYTASTKPKNKCLLFLIAIDTETSDVLRQHICLDDDAVPLLAAVDFPKRRLAVMQYGAEITTVSVQNFLDDYLSGQSEFKTLRPFVVEGDNNEDGCD